ncbi:MAG: cryptochrome/photolyase family protein [Bacteroidota bacterium]
MPHTLRLVLGDQLNQQHSWFDKVEEDILYVMMEVRQETDYVKHHVQKVVAFFSAMRSFQEDMKAKGHRFHYITLDDPANQQDFAKNLDELIEQHGIKRFEYQAPDEYRLDVQLAAYADALDLETEMVDTEHFLTSRTELAEMFRGKKTYLMESFYRKMRKKYDIMMESEDKPFSGKWNYDHSNRNKYDGAFPIPKPLNYAKEVEEILNLLEKNGVESFGRIKKDEFFWPTSRAQALDALEFFVEECLPNFGTYQDAMTRDNWSLFHARLSFPINAKILHPLEVVNRAIEEWEKNSDSIDIAQIEGFVRQIIGWREYMRGVYWAHMPEYAELNYFGHERKLPAWFWTGETKMSCLSHAINNSLDNAYAHHIQRLMVTGNFALLAGIHPDELDAWYLGIYIDAIEWVEITNTRGMSQFADGGLVGTKPYVSSANYMNKMSDYCKGCHYDKKLKVGEKACPFNSLYWHFYQRNEDKLGKNPRIGMAYRNLAKMKADTKEAIMLQAESYLAELDNL